MENNTTTAAPNMILESYSMDYTTRIHHAVRADGQWFTRMQERHPQYGYRWTAWRATSVAGEGHSTGRKARLPKEVA